MTRSHRWGTSLVVAGVSFACAGAPTIPAPAPPPPVPGWSTVATLGDGESRLPGACGALAYVGDELVAATSRGVVELRAGEPLRLLPGEPGPSGGVPVAAFSPDGSRVAISMPSGGVQVIDRRSGRHRVLQGPKRSVESLAWLPDDRLVASRTNGWPHSKAPGGTVAVWADGDGAPQMFTPDCRVNLQLRRAGRSLLAHCGAGEVQTLDLTTRALRPVPSPYDGVSDVWADPDGGRWVVSGWPRSSSWRVGAAAPDVERDGYVSLAAIDGDTFAWATEEEVGLQDGARRVRAWTLRAGDHPTAVAVSQRAARVAVCAGHALLEWDAATGAPTREPPPGHGWGVQAAAVGADGVVAATADPFGVVVWGVAAGTERARLQIPSVRKLAIVGDRVHVWGDDGVTAFTLDGDPAPGGMAPRPAPESVPLPEGASVVRAEGDFAIAGYPDGTAQVFRIR